MQSRENKTKNVKIAYIGGGSRGWAWALMKDLALAKSISGEVSLYDIDYEAAQNNAYIGNLIYKQNPDMSKWEYKAEKTLEQALTGADFALQNPEWENCIIPTRRGIRCFPLVLGKMYFANSHNTDTPIFMQAK